MYYYKTTIQYAGTNYAGFQWQNGIQTVQSVFNRSLSIIVEGKFTTMASSRTDTGVHAIGQVVKISSSNPIDLDSFLEDFNKHLPPDIMCISIEVCDGLFKPAASALSKEYRYFFSNKINVSKEDSQFITNFSKKLDLEAMTICVQAILGLHDFCNFYSSGSNVKSTVRKVFLCELTLVNPQDIFSGLDLFLIPIDLNECYQFRIQANGFLKQMIRHLISALWMVGTKKISVNNFLEILDGPKIEKQMRKVASPNGLFLYRINYD